MKPIKKKIDILFSLIAIALSGCSNVGYNGRFFDDVEQHLNETFVNEHQVKTSWGGTDKPLTYVIDCDNKYSAAFKDDYKIDINYEKQFMIVCSFTSIYRKKHNLETLKLNDGVLTIECDSPSAPPGVGDASSPYQRWCAVLMDIVEYNTIDFSGE